MSKTKPLDQMSSTSAYSLDHTAKIQNKIEPHSNILKRLMEFASSVPDFRRLAKGNIRHRLSDIILLILLGRSSKCVGRAEIIEFGRHHSIWKRLRKKRADRRKGMAELMRYVSASFTKLIHFLLQK